MGRLIRWVLDKIARRIAGNVPERGIEQPAWGDEDLTPTATETPRAKLSAKAKAMRAEAGIPPKPRAETDEPLHGSREWRVREAKRRAED